MTIATQARSRANTLNQACQIVFRDDVLFDQIVSQTPDLKTIVPDDFKRMFANEAVFVSREDFQSMVSLVKAVETLSKLPGWRTQALFHLSPDMRADQGTTGMFMGYDFHLTKDGPRLIEINTNAGGGFLNAFAQKALKACCDDAQPYLDHHDFPDFDSFVVAAFIREWQSTGREGQPKTIAILDDTPAGQFLYPEFLLAQSLFARHGIAAVIADPRELKEQSGKLYLGHQLIDMVYNRLVDFRLEAPELKALKQGWMTGNVVVTPDPVHHALFANKRNLTLLSDPAQLAQMGASNEVISALGIVPETRLVTPDQADEFWAHRKDYFFKPLSGYGGKAVWRGDKLTRKTWAEIISGEYVAQRLAVPGSRQVILDGEQVEQKIDLRLYTYAGEVFLMAARLYRGQTTNFRTPGGGFAPVCLV